MARKLACPHCAADLKLHSKRHCTRCRWFVCKACGALCSIDNHAHQNHIVGKPINYGDLCYR